GVTDGSSLGNRLGRDLRRVMACVCQHHPIDNILLLLALGKLSRRTRDSPSGSDELKFTPLNLAIRAERDAKIADLGGSETGASINMLVDDQRASDTAADRDIEEGRKTEARAESSFGQTGCVGVVFQHNARHRKLVPDPRLQGKIVPTCNLVRALCA